MSGLFHNPNKKFRLKNQNLLKSKKQVWRYVKNIFIMLRSSSADPDKAPL